MIWVGPLTLWDALPRPAPTEGFDSSAYGSGVGGAALAIRGMGFLSETPFVEKLFVRNFLLRFVDVFKIGADFRSVPLARYTRLNFWFTISHATWSMGSLSRPESCSTFALPQGPSHGDGRRPHRRHLACGEQQSSVPNLLVGIRDRERPRSRAARPDRDARG